MDRPRHVHVMPESLTRSQVAERLGLSVSSVRRLEREGTLTPEVGDGGVRLFAQEQVDALAAQRQVEPPPESSAATTTATPQPPADGALTALAFAHFDQGETPVQVVQTLELPAPTVKALYRQWRELSDLVLEGW